MTDIKSINSNKKLNKVSGGKKESQRSPQGRNCFRSIRGGINVEEAYCARFKIPCSDYDICTNKGKVKY